MYLPEAFNIARWNITLSDFNCQQCAVKDGIHLEDKGYKSGIVQILNYLTHKYHFEN